MIEKLPEEERAQAPRVEERISIANGKTLFLSGRPGAGYQVWIDGSFDFSGVRIGAGPTKPEARQAAIQLLLEAVRTLRGLQGGGDVDAKIWTASI